MEREIAAFEARRKFGKLLSEVAANGHRYVVERHGEAIAAVVPIQLYEQSKRSRDAFLDRMEAAARHANMSEDDAMALALEAVRVVRAKHRASR